MVYSHRVNEPSSARGGYHIFLNVLGFYLIDDIREVVGVVVSCFHESSIGCRGVTEEFGSFLFEDFGDLQGEDVLGEDKVWDGGTDFVEHIIEFAEYLVCDAFLLEHLLDQSKLWCLRRPPQYRHNIRAAGKDNILAIIILLHNILHHLDIIIHTLRQMLNTPHLPNLPIIRPHLIFLRNKYIRPQL